MQIVSKGFAGGRHWGFQWHFTVDCICRAPFSRWTLVMPEAFKFWQMSTLETMLGWEFWLPAPMSVWWVLAGGLVSCWIAMVGIFDGSVSSQDQPVTWWGLVSCGVTMVGIFDGCVGSQCQCLCSECLQGGLWVVESPWWVYLMGVLAASANVCVVNACRGACELWSHHGGYIWWLCWQPASATKIYGEYEWV